MDGKRSRPTTKTLTRQGLFVDAETSARLGRIRQEGTSPELTVRRLLHALGHRFRVHNRDLPGSPDVVNRRRKWAIFVHGCFWHRHTNCKGTTTPSRNREFWIAKFDTNVARDTRVEAALRCQGYLVLVVWECETKDVKRMSNLRRRLAEIAVTAPTQAQLSIALPASLLRVTHHGSRAQLLTRGAS
jgi:DNA mismatch endonuclease (patch repair protein)